MIEPDILSLLSETVRTFVNDSPAHHDYILTPAPKSGAHCGEELHTSPYESRVQTPSLQAQKRVLDLGMMNEHFAVKF